MAELRDPEFSSIGADISIRAAEMHLLVNDVPVFDPMEPFGGASELETQLRLNPSFRKGRNSVTVLLRMLPDGEFGMVPFFRMDLGNWEFMSFPDVFDGRPMAVRMQVDLVTPETGGAAVQQLTSQIDALPLMGANEPARVSADAEGWVTYRFDVNIDVDLPAMAWMNGEVLEDTPAMRQSLVAAMREVHGALGQGSAASRPLLEGFAARNAAAVGAPVEVFYARSIAPMIDDEGTELVPFDVAESELRLFGNGRLASFLPLPHRFRDLESEGWQTSLYLYYWKEDGGQWRVIH